MSFLEVKNINVFYGESQVLWDVSFYVEKGQLVTLVGANGAGKTTTFNLITGFYKPDEGDILFNGERINGLNLHQTFHKGLCRTFQISRELKLMTVLENLMLVSPHQDGENLLKTWFMPGLVKKEETANRDKALSILKSVNLIHLKDEYAGNLSGGQKRLLELARSMMSGAKLILFDEPGAGVNPIERKTLAARIRELVEKQNITVLLIGHEMELVMDICDPIIVMDWGKKLMEGTPDEVATNPQVLEVYLGGAKK